jgi:hypothetical protein
VTDWLVTGVLTVGAFLLGAGLALTYALGRVLSFIHELQAVIAPLLRSSSPKTAGGLLGLIQTIIQAKPDIVNSFLGRKQD